MVWCARNDYNINFSNVINIMDLKDQIRQQIKEASALAHFGLEKGEEERDLLSYYWFKEGFSKEECEKIREVAKSYELNEASTFDNENSNIKDNSQRKSNIRWIDYNNNTSWIYKKLEGYVMEANNNIFKVDLTGFTEPLQYTEYEGEGTHYGYHIDIGPGKHKRKISIVVQLSDPSDYEGGELEIQNGGTIVCDKGLGDVFLFPSILLHRVNKVISGNRHSLVSWVGGPPWR